MKENHIEGVEGSGGDLPTGGPNDPVSITTTKASKLAQSLTNTNAILLTNDIASNKMKANRDNEHADEVEGSGGDLPAGGPNDPVNTSTITTLNSTEDSAHNNAIKEDRISGIEGSGGDLPAGGPNDPVHNSIIATSNSVKNSVKKATTFNNDLGRNDVKEERVNGIEGSGGDLPTGGPNDPASASTINTRNSVENSVNKVTPFTHNIDNKDAKEDQVNGVKGSDGQLPAGGPDDSVNTLTMATLHSTMANLNSTMETLISAMKILNSAIKTLNSNQVLTDNQSITNTKDAHSETKEDHIKAVEGGSGGQLPFGGPNRPVVINLNIGN